MANRRIYRSYTITSLTGTVLLSFATPMSLRNERDEKAYAESLRREWCESNGYPLSETKLVTKEV